MFLSAISRNFTKTVPEPPGFESSPNNRSP